MFDTIRDHKKFLMGFLLILIIPSFVLFGIEGYSRFNEGGPPVATVNGKDITRMEWDRFHQEESQRVRQAMPQIDAKLLDSEEARYATLERLVRQRVVAAAATQDHLYTSDARLAAYLQQDPAIAGLRKPDGSLDVEGYRQLLARQGMTPEGFEAAVRNELSQRQVTEGLLASAFTPSGAARPSLNAFFEQRQVRVIPFSAADQAGRVQITDAELEAFHKDNPQLFQAPEQADIEYLVLDAAALERSVTLNEADVRAYYEQNAQRLSGDEQRRASHILLSVPAGASATDKDAVKAKAQALLEQVRKDPQKFAELAKANSQDPGSADLGGDLDFFGRGAMVKPFEDAVFGLKKGDIADLVETEFGFHIIRLTDIKAPPRRSFEEMRASIEADLRKQQAQRLFAESADIFSNTVYEQADSLQPAAERLKLTVQTAKGLTRQGNGQPGVLSNPRLLEAVFSTEAINSKRNIEAVETGANQLVSARVVQHRAARTLDLAEVRDQATAALKARRAGELARAEGEKRLKDLQAGTATGNLPASATISRGIQTSLPPQVLNAALSADPASLPQWIGVSLGDRGYAVVQVEKVLPATERNAQQVAQEVQQYGQWWNAAEAAALYEMLKERTKARILVPRPATETTAAR
ncbi:SurA N-terminal domain-containing protein [Hydrogenophaga sp. IBVHS2]|uniref:SurA N-terminal domain-containing protein n=1 Tax=Hydrogenophaga sp. IBVHS2 TaxID=1985170 RepID=UPI000A2E8755|nr:SurA N-terminal domain-containing protein [Hydrogenophaga sp. IBVHS2]OSZ67821.1 peptidylprolyl isomerase [Hydrogenophaga sp. IBVHS2]